MLKKFTWIVALLAALTIVIGCTNAGLDPEWDDPDKDFKKIDLIALDDDGEKVIFNTFAGQPDKQGGWATDGYIDDENGVTVESTLKVSDFTGARFLVIETAKNPTGGLHLVWQSKNFPDNGWKTQDKSVLADNSNANPGTTKKTGNAYGGATIRVDLPIALGGTYGNFLAATDFMRFIIAYYSPDLAGLDVQEAYLLVSDKKSPISPEIEGLSNSRALGSLGQTNIRISADEYGWQFSELVKAKQPKDTLPIDELRDADYLLLVTKGGGIGVNGGLGGYSELAVTLEFTSSKIKTTAATPTVAEKKEKIASKSGETILYSESIAFLHSDAEEVFFVIDLSDLDGFGDIAATVGGSGTNSAENAFDNISLILNYAPMDNLGLVQAYLFDSTALGTLPTVDGTDTINLGGTYLGQTLGPFGIITREDVLLPALFQAPVDVFTGAMVDDDGAPSTTEGYSDNAFANFKKGWLPATGAAALKAVTKPGSFVRVTVTNHSGGNRSNWGCGDFGGYSWNAPDPLNATVTVNTFDVLVADLDLSNAAGVNFNSWNLVEITGAELYVAK